MAAKSKLTSDVSERTLHEAHYYLTMEEEEAARHLTCFVRYIQSQPHAKEYDPAVNSKSKLYRANLKLAQYSITALTTTSLSASLDNLVCLAKLLDEASIRPVVGGFTLLRGAIEAEAQTLFLLGSRKECEMIERRLRIAKADLNDANNLRRTLGSTDVAEQISELETLSTSLGVSSGRLNKWLKFSDIVKFADSESRSGGALYVSWQITSGISHSRPWAFKAVINKHKLAGERNTFGEANIASSDHGAMNYLLFRACVGHEMAVRLSNIRAQGLEDNRENLFKDSASAVYDHMPTPA